MSDLTPGMTLEGTVTNVTNFGAFVDIGVRQDGLVHLSQMSNRFIRDPREAVKVGDVVQVKVISIEPETKRIGLSMKALLPALQRRKKKQPAARGQNLRDSSRRPEGVAPEAAAGADPSSPAASAERPSPAGAQQRPGRTQDGRRPFRRKEPAKTGKHRGSAAEKRDLRPRGPSLRSRKKSQSFNPSFEGSSNSPDC